MSDIKARLQRIADEDKGDFIAETAEDALALIEVAQEIFTSVRIEDRGLDVIRHEWLAEVRGEQ